MADNANPLSKFFRQPQLYLKLPSDGKWYPNSALEMPETRELPIYAMTAMDEISLKTPDALLNGQSTVSVIQSCVPNIKNAWLMPSVDIDAVLIAIRRASYGNQLDFTSICPHCKIKNEHGLDLSFLADKITCPNFEKTVKLDGLEIYLKPQSFKSVNETSKENYEQQRLLAIVSNKELSELEKSSQFNELFLKLLAMTVNSVANSIGAIKIKDGPVVEDRDMIFEFLQKCNRDVWEQIKSKISETSEDNFLNKIPLKCLNEECLKDYTSPLIFEASNFFG